MLTRYHEAITREALSPHFTPDAIRLAIRANLAQDSLRGQIGHQEYHVDDNIADGYAYMVAQRDEALQWLLAGDCLKGLKALGRCLHCVQDFYSHTNYVRLWLAENGGLERARPEDIAPLHDWLSMGALQTGRAVFREGLLYVPVLGRLLAGLVRLPPNAHFFRNLDAPHRGPEFAYVRAAATKHSELVVKSLLEAVTAQKDTAPLPCLVQNGVHT